MNFKSRLMVTYYRLKGIGIFAYIPFIVVFLLVPLTNYAVYTHFKDYDMLYQNIITVSQNIIAFFSAWNSIFILYHFVEQPGNEVLYLEGRNRFFDIVIPFLIYIVSLLPLFVVYNFIFCSMWLYFVKICLLSFVVLMIVYVFTYLFHSISPAFICIMGISVLGIIMQGLFVNRIDYREKIIDIREYLLFEIGPFAILAFVLLLIGRTANRSYTKYR